MEEHEVIALGNARAEQANKMVERIKALDPEDPERAILLAEMLQYGQDITNLLKALGG